MSRFVSSHYPQLSLKEAMFPGKEIQPTISFGKISENKRNHNKEFFECFYLSGHTIGFNPVT